MSLPNLAAVCSHLQNASRARLSLTSVPMTKLHLALALAMQKQGLVSTVQVAGKTPPIPHAERTIPQPWRDDLENQLKAKPWLGLAYDEARDHSAKQTWQEKRAMADDEVPANPAKRRIWLGLKYWNNEPVLAQMGLISKPTRRISAKLLEITALTRGRKAGYVPGLINPGECIFVNTDVGILEAREAVQRKRGGQLLCRVN